MKGITSVLSNQFQSIPIKITKIIQYVTNNKYDIGEL